MSDNEAVSWSNYSSHRTSIEYEVRHKVAKELLEHIRFLDKNKAPECYIQGMDRARLFVLHNASLKDSYEQLDYQERLF